jgi:hypothetical protein
MDITKETGKTPESSAKYLLKQKDLDDVPKEYRVRLERWISNKNGQDEYEMGSSIAIPDEKDIIKILLVRVPIKSEENEKQKGEPTEAPAPQLKGWQLIKNEGKLVQVDTGWLTDENGLYILKDGRRVTDEEAKKPINKGLRFGTEDNPEAGLWDILCGMPSQGVLTEYNSIGLLNDKDLVDKMPVVIFHALQINVCYTANTPIILYGPNTDVSFLKIGTDETKIPIVITKIAGKVKIPSSAIPTPHNKDSLFQGLKKLVIAGPHGDERNALFAVLETQKHFIKEAARIPENLILYFAPAISPTFFFADARGLPLDNEGKLTKNYPTATDLQRAVCNKLKDYKIPMLHDEIIRFIYDKNSKTMNTFQKSIQAQPDSTKPEYGIDTNRDVYNLLPSTRVFLDFIDTRVSGGTSYDDIAVFMLHGYESIIRERLRNDVNNLPSRGTVTGPYKLDGDNGYMEEKTMNRIDFITSELFGYTYARGNPNGKINCSKNYFFKADPNVGKEFNGEWARKLYLDGKNGQARRIQCFDIELPDNYREGARYPPGKSGNDTYESDKVVNRYTKRNMPFFNEATNGKFVNDTSSFYEFLLRFFDKRDKT